MAAGRTRRPGWLTLVLSLILGFVTFLVAGIGMLVGEHLPVDTTTFGEALGALSAAGFVALLGGAKWLRPSLRNIAYTFRFGWWCLVVTFGLLAFDLIAFPVLGDPVSKQWPIRLVEVTVLCLVIGLFEEFVFRGLVFQGLLAAFGKRHSGVVIAVVTASIIFGLAHIDPSLSFDTPLMVGQAILKILQTGMFGFMLAIVALQRKDLVGPACFHGFDNWALLVVSYAFYDHDLELTYVSDDAGEGFEMLCLYVIICLLYLPFVIKSVRTLMQMRGPNRGAFVHEDDPLPAYMPVAPIPVGDVVTEDWAYQGQIVQASRDALALPDNPNGAARAMAPYGGRMVTSPSMTGGGYGGYSPYAEPSMQRSQPYSNGPTQESYPSPTSYPQPPSYPDAAPYPISAPYPVSTSEPDAALHSSPTPYPVATPEPSAEPHASPALRPDAAPYSSSAPVQDAALESSPTPGSDAVPYPDAVSYPQTAPYPDAAPYPQPTPYPQPARARMQRPMPTQPYPAGQGVAQSRDGSDGRPPRPRGL